MKVLTSSTCLFLFCFPLSLSAQNRISGKIFNQKEQPLTEANVLLLKTIDSSLVKGSATAKDGSFSFENVKTGSYLVMVTCTGYNRQYIRDIDITSTLPQLDMKTIRLTEEVIELQQVTVQSRRPLLEQKIDRLVVNVKNSITSAGATALDILERSPGVIVNRQANSIIMSGKDGVTVMINGKISHMPLSALVQMLEGMNAGNIDRIELITTPPANLDAQGNAGYINIVLLQNPNFGFNGSFSTGVGYGDGLATAHSINFNYRKNKLNLFGDYSVGVDKRKPNISNYRRVQDQGTVRESNTFNDRYPTRLTQNARLGLDYQITNNTLLGVLASAFMNRYSMHETIFNHNYTNHQKDTQIIIRNTEVNNWRNADFNINLQHTIKPGETISFDANYLVYKNKQPFNYNNNYYNSQGQLLFVEDVRTNKTTPIKFRVIKADYTKNFNPKTSMEAGLKFTSSRFDNDVKVERSQNNGWNIDSLYSSYATLKENISAAYLSYNINPGEKTTLKMGLRYEYINSNLGTVSVKNIVDRHYGRLFPNFFISQKLSDKRSINFSYSRRINRPAFNDMAPFIFFFDPNTFVSGNSALQPAISDNFKTGYTFGKYLVSLSYSHEDNFIAFFQSRIDPKTNKQIVTAENLKYVQTAALVLSLPFDITKWWSMQNNITGVWQQAALNDTNEKTKVRQANVNIRVVQVFQLPKNLSMELSGFYQSTSIFGRYKVKPYGQLDIGAQKKFTNNNEKIRLAFTNIFSTYKWTWQTDTGLDNFSKTILQFSKATVNLTYSRSFGRNSVKAARERSTGAAEEKQRVN